MSEATMNSRKDLYHFVLSLLIVIGGGYLWATRPDLAGEVGAVMGTVVGWWFGKAANGNGSRPASAIGHH